MAFAKLGGYLCEVKIPEHAEPRRICNAELIGYEVPPADVFSCGACMFILAWRAPPWRQCLLEDPYFAYIYKEGDAGLAKLVQSWRMPLLTPPAMQLLVRMLRPNPLARPTAQDCLSCPWISGAAGAGGADALPPQRAPPVPEPAMRATSMEPRQETWHSAASGEGDAFGGDPYRGL